MDRYLKKKNLAMKETIRLVQLSHPVQGRKIALVEEPDLLFLMSPASIFDLVLEAIHRSTGMDELIRKNLSDDRIDYTSVYEGKTDWSILPSFDCPQNPFACLVSGTGLTHKNSALNRQMMHTSEQSALTDSMKMYQWGLDGGRPTKGSIGIQPEWFYKGTGQVLKGHGSPLEVPRYGNDGGEEPEVAVVYVTGKSGQVYRVGFTTGNEFSDHVMEKKNYLYLAPSKLRNCSIGPELVIDASFEHIEGTVSIVRAGNTLWSAPVNTGERNMAHSLENLEYHHLKYADHRQPLQAHVHFLGADAFSFGAGVQLEDGDEMIVHWKGMGRALVNPISITKEKESLIEIRSICSPSQAVAP
jgi:hypothetical protein